MTGNNKHIGFEDFRRYKANEMTPEERNAFEKELQKDPFLAEAFEGMEQVDAEEMAAGVKELSQKIVPPKRKLRVQLIASAASILLLISIGIIWLQIDKEDPVPKISQSSELEKPAETRVEEKRITLKEAEIATPEIDNTLKEIKTVEPEPQKPEAAPQTVERIAEISPVEKKAPAVIAETEDEAKEDIQIHEALSGRVQGITVTANDSQPEVNVSNLANSKERIMIRGVASIKENTASSKTVRGYVISAEDKQALPGVSIVENGTSNGAVTNINGEFTLNLIDSNATLRASFIGMEQYEFYPDKDKIDTIALENDDASLEEVVVIGYGTQKKQSMTGSVTRVETDSQARHEEATPLGGYNEFREYLKQNALLPDDYQENKEVVRLKIALDAHGNINGFELLNDAPEAFFDKAKNLILQGPKWQPAQSGERATDSFVTLRIVFRKSE